MIGIVLADSTAEPHTVTVALIALGGAIVGGFLTAGAQLLAETMKAKRERDLQWQTVVGVSRVVSHYLESWRQLLEGAMRKEGWWYPDSEPSPAWHHADLQNLAAVLSPDRWRKVKLALAAADTCHAGAAWAEENKVRFSDSAVSKPKASGKLTGRIAIETLNAGVEALSDAADE